MLFDQDWSSPDLITKCSTLKESGLNSWDDVPYEGYREIKKEEVREEGIFYKIFNKLRS